MSNIEETKIWTSRSLTRSQERVSDYVVNCMMSFPRTVQNVVIAQTQEFMSLHSDLTENIALITAFTFSIIQSPYVQ